MEKNDSSNWFYGMYLFLLALSLIGIGMMIQDCEAETRYSLQTQQCQQAGERRYSCLPYSARVTQGNCSCIVGEINERSRISYQP